ncbi:hypothetical protein [Amycolatopsis sp. cmx-11-51]|uniref:hypothetical protein n=1 Tax=Amycolatopsis sp. cmx-11-51 TaxID=2785797 RepID=UPI0039E5538D
MPEDWNGTLVLWSHGRYSVAYPEPVRIALAASQYRAVRGWSIEKALTDQIRLQGWFGRTVGPPRRTIAAGESVRAITATCSPSETRAGLMTFCGNLPGRGRALELRARSRIRAAATGADHRS